MSEIHQNQQWREEVWRKAPGKAGQSRLRALAKDPELTEEVRLERRLTEALGNLKDVPISSNFTSRVLQEAMRPENKPVRSQQHPFFRWLPRLAFGCVLFAAGFFSWQHIESTREAEIARSVVTVSTTAVTSPDILQDFEAIRALSSSPPADEQLLALMQ